MALVAVCAGCSAPTKYVWFTSVPQDSVRPRLTTVEPRDRISVVVLDHPELSAEHLVGADGTFVQPLAGPTAVSGKTVNEAAAMIAERLKPYLQQPLVAVTLIEAHPIRVNVLGEVRSPGTYEIRHDDNLLSALARAGGFSDFADQDSIYLLRSQGASPRVRFRYSDLEQPHPKAIGFPLHDGDTIVIE